MKQFVTLILLLVIGNQLWADEREAASVKQSVSERANEEESPPPKTLDEAHQHLEKLLLEEDLAKIDAMKSEDEMIEYHFGLGSSMHNSWGLWAGGPLAKHMNKLGFHHADDMSGVILDTFWCKRHKKDFKLKKRAAYYETYWKATATPPETAKDLKDGSDIDWSMAFNEKDGKTPRVIHVGKSKKTGLWRAYEYDKGVYEPDEELLKRIQKPAPLDPFDPFDPNYNPHTK